MPETLRVLILEDDETDAQLVVAELRRSGYEPVWRRVVDEKAYLEQLDESPDIILADYRLPQFDGLSALRHLKERGLDIPFILVTGATNEDAPVQCLKEGASDYLLKDRLSRLGQAVEHALREKVLRAEKAGAETALRASEERFRLLAENAQDVIYRLCLRPNYHFEYLSPAIVTMTGYTPDEIYSQPDLGLGLVDPDDLAWLRGLVADDIRIPVVVRFRRRDGTVILVEQRNVAIYDDSGGLVAIEGIARDITERKQAEEKVKALNAALESRALELDGINRVLLAEVEERRRAEAAIARAKQEWERTFDSIPDLIAVVGQDRRVIRVNRALATHAGITPQEAAGRPCYEIFHAGGFPPHYCPFPEMLASGHDHQIELHEESLGGDFLVTHSVITGSDQSPVGYVASARDISELKQSQRTAIESLERLERALEGTVQAMAQAVEGRDPYTAGHQRRVASLARCIAVEMGLTDHQIRSVHLASGVHDIGKINVPAEFLSKPGRLTDTEFSLIKAHSRTGYDILKNIDFPWPVADIVLQHHERMDGSGYPQQLGGADILLEARILAVADVVEAMSSHRPYRPALGMDQAMEEISRNSGKLYDPDVVAACVVVISRDGLDAA